MSDYTPDTQKVEDRYWLATVGNYGWKLRAGEEDARAEFRRWLTEHDAKVRAETLREFAHSIPGDVHDPRHVADLARGVADHIEKEAGLK